MNDTPVKTTKRRCRWCGGEYRTPVGSKPAGCPDCAPTLLEPRQMDVHDCIRVAELELDRKPA